MNLNWLAAIRFLLVLTALLLVPATPEESQGLVVAFYAGTVALAGFAMGR